MALLVLFAVVAGAGTALTPCVLPVLPALLAAGASGGRRRPLGIVTGHTITFTLTIVALASVVDGVGLGDELARNVAVVMLAGFGVALIVPAIGARLEAPLSRLARFGPRPSSPRGEGEGRGEGFWSGLLVGAALGFVYAPCAGPILAGVISVAATQGASLELVAVAVGFGTGSAAVLLLLAYGGRRVAERVRRAGRGPALQRALGVVMIATAVAIATELDVEFQTALADDAPAFLVNPTRALERSDAVERRLADLRGRSRFESSDRATASGAAAEGAAAAGGSNPGARYEVLGRAPEFQGEGPWLGSRPLTLAGLRGRVVLIDFWTYTCINCIRTLPYLRAWDRRYRRRGLTIVGVHTPEFTFERETDNVRDAIERNDLRYPVIQDNDYATWNAWGNRYWPAKYLIDARGRVRYVHFGEGDYEETDAAIRALLAEAGAQRLGERVRANADAPSPGLATPETYLGYERAERFLPPLLLGTHDYAGLEGEDLPDSHFALRGVWRVDGESAMAVNNAGIDARFTAAKVFLVLSSRGGAARSVRVSVDGRPLGSVTVRKQRLYDLVALPSAGTHLLSLDFEPGVSGYAFTFG